MKNVMHKKYYYPEDLKVASVVPNEIKHKDEIDIRNILNNNKFIPIWLQRESLGLKAYDKLPPYSVELHLTSVCNYDCYHCSYANRRKSAVYLKQEIINGLIDNLINSTRAKGVYFSGGGEPTTLKNWDLYIKRLLENNIEVSLVTNGSLIKPQHLPIISNLNYIAISIYSIKSETAKKITGSKKIEHSFLLPEEIKKHSGKTVVGARCVINRFNYDEIIDIYNKAIDSGFDYIIFIPEIDYENRGVCLTMEQVNKMRELVWSSSIDNKKANLELLAKNQFNYYPQADNKEIFNHIDCQAIKLRTNAFVNYDGGVYLCQPHIGNKTYCIGNIVNKRFEDIWNSEKHKKVIDSLAKQWARGHCLNCRSIGFNKTIHEYNNIDCNQPIEIIKDSFV